MDEQQLLQAINAATTDGNTVLANRLAASLNDLTRTRFAQTQVQPEYEYYEPEYVEESTQYVSYHYESERKFPLSWIVTGVLVLMAVANLAAPGSKKYNFIFFQTELPIPMFGEPK